MNRNYIFLVLSFAFIFAWLCFWKAYPNPPPSTSSSGMSIQTAFRHSGSPGSGRVSFTKRIRRLIAIDRSDNSKVSSYINQQMVRSPFSADGVNKDAAAYYNITDEKAKEIEQVSMEVRMLIVHTIVAQLTPIPDKEGAESAWLYRASPELIKAAKSMLLDRLTSIVDKDFAEKCVPALRSDDRFLAGGQLDIYFHVMAEDHSKTAGDARMKIEFRTPEGKLAASWEGPAENVKSTLLLDFTAVKNR